jgi:hypothetical protein
VIDFGKVTGEFFFASAARMVQVHKYWRWCHHEAHQQVDHGSTLERSFVEILETYSAAGPRPGLPVRQADRYTLSLLCSIFS